MIAASRKSILCVAVCLFVASVYSLEERSCAGRTSCRQCGEDNNCKWCALSIVATVDSVDFEKTMYPLGACLPKATPCKSVEFGTLKDLSLNFKRIGGVDVSVTELPTTDERCTKSEMPIEIVQPSCAACHGLGDDFGWCDGRVSGFIERKGGICIRKSLSYLCHPQLIPALPRPFSMLKFSASYANVVADCGTYRRRSYTEPSRECSANLSCHACGDSPSGCTWCGGVMSGQVQKKTMQASLFGVCVRGTNSFCDVHFGSLKNAVNSRIGKGNATFEVSAIGRSDSLCTSVEWPNVFAEPTCQSCLSRGGSGWCQIGISNAADATEILRKLFIFQRKIPTLFPSTTQVDDADEKEENVPDADKNVMKVVDLPDADENVMKVVDLPDEDQNEMKVVDLPDEDQNEMKVVDLPDEDQNEMKDILINERDVLSIFENDEKFDGSICLEESWSFLCSPKSERMRSLWLTKSCSQ